MRVLYLIAALLVASRAEAAPQAQTQTPTQRAAAALVASEKCGGNLTGEMNSVLAVAVQQEGTGAVKAAEFSYRALWTESGLDSDPIRHDAMCAQIFRNGWLQ